LAKQYLKPNSVGIFARGRAMYGRNLSPEFYVNLIKMLEDLGYNPIWLGEKQKCAAVSSSSYYGF
jgi:alkanesulfonate monooxygenase SsuD/methylene tetrahydromethanopterin reductase-like flavin-dependent oxidoreductase (luciferase family)